MITTKISSLKKLSERESEIKKDIKDRNILKAFGDVNELPKSLQDKWTKVVQEKGESVYFDKVNVIFQVKAGYIFSSLPELFFACYMYDFYKYLFKYYETVMEILKKHPEISRSDYKDIAIQAKEQATGPLVDAINSSDISQEDKAKLLEFATDYKEWAGGKSIYRENDFYISPIYSVLDIVQSKSGIHSFFPYLKDDNLYRETESFVEKSIDEYNGQVLKDPSSIENITRKANGTNIIYYGAPGTGKSYEVNNIIKEKYSDYDASAQNDNVFRVTLHPEYAYSDFVGQLLPYNDNGHVDYRFIPGIFTNALSQAYWHPDKDVFLVLEEMSRANVAAVFGDLFQLLDRKNGSSEYAINNEEIAKIVYKDPKHKVIIPSNMTIFGTVNTSDQNVFVMDTAFKRRFDWKYISTDAGADSDDFKNNNNPKINIGDDTIVTWKTLYQALNRFIVGDLGLSEDKQIGPYFIKFEDADPATAHELVRDKLLQYLWEDINSTAMEMYTSSNRLFEDRDKISSFSDLYNKFGKKEKVFSDSFIKSLGVSDIENSSED